MRDRLFTSALLRTRGRRLGVAAAAALVVVGAVLRALHGGGASASPQQPAGPAAATSLSAAATATPGQGSRSASATPPPGTGAHAATPRPPAPAVATAAWFSVALGASCVVPGGTQTLTAQSRPGYTVAYNSRYADGRTGDTDGGYGVVATDAHGRVSVSWTVSASAPLGTVTVGAGTANGGPATTLTRSFTVAAHC